MKSTFESADNGVDTSIALHMEENNESLITPAPLKGKKKRGKGGGNTGDVSIIQFQAPESGGFKKLQSGFWVITGAL